MTAPLRDDAVTLAVRGPHRQLQPLTHCGAAPIRWEELDAVHPSRE